MRKILLCLLFLSQILLLVNPNPSGDVFNLMKRAAFSPWALGPYSDHEAEDDLKPGLKYSVDTAMKIKAEELLAFLSKYQKDDNSKKRLLPWVFLRHLYDF